MEEYLKVAQKVALKAGKLMLSHFDTHLKERIKQDETIVTIADEAINEMVIKELESHFPDHSIWGEEASSIKSSPYTWLCDPIDGTVPFAKAVPVSVFSLALVTDGQPIVGVVYDPFTQRMYTAARGLGAYVNKQPTHVNRNQLHTHSVVNIEWWPDALFDLDTALHQLSKATNCYVLHLGSVINAASLVAYGKYDACIFAGTTGKAVDIAAVKIIVEEAGGKVTDLYGREQRYDGDITGAIISNGIVHEQILQTLVPFLK